VSNPVIHESGISTRIYTFWCTRGTLDKSVTSVLSRAILSIEETIAYYEKPNGSTHAGALPLDDFSTTVTLTPAYTLTIDYHLNDEPQGSSEDRKVNTGNLVRVIERPSARPATMATSAPGRPMVDYLTLTTPSLSDLGDLLGRVINAVKRLAKKLVQK